MATAEIEYREKRLTGLAVFPMRPAVGGIPRLPRCGKLVIGLGIVRAVVAGLAEENGERLHERRQLGVAPHVVGAKRGLIHAGDDAGPAWRTDSGRGEGVGIADTLFG